MRNDCLGFLSRARGRALPTALLSLWALFGCHGGKPSNTPTEALTLEQAQAIVDAVRAEHGAPPPAPGPTSLAEVMTVIRRDESERFSQTRDYLTTLPGVDALILKATVELLWTDGQMTVADLARELTQRREAEVAALEESLKAQPNDAGLKARLDKAAQQAEHERKLEHALNRLAEPHYDAAMTLAREIERRNPERPESYSLLVNLFRLRREWAEFEHNAGMAEAREPGRVDILYARAMERAERLGDRAGARAQLEALLQAHPDFARARAQLLLLQDDVEARHQQLEALKALNPRHALVVLAGNAIEREYNTAMELRAARAPASSAP
jgi:hypothetical protein